MGLNERRAQKNFETERFTRVLLRMHQASDIVRGLPQRAAECSEDLSFADI